MSSNKPIFIVAKFEVKTLLRSWFFRIFSAIVIAFLLFFNIVASTEIGRFNFADRMMPGGLVYMNLWILNIVQSIIAVFLSSDFLSRDKKLDTTEVIYVRSMSNFEYVFGKTLGIFYVFGGLNLLVLLFTFIINIISTDAGFSAITYLIYPLIVSLPTLMFVLGLSFFVMQLVKNQAITFILVLGYIATNLFYLKGNHYGSWDFIGFFSPMAYSDYVGLGNLFQIASVRIGYFILGISLMFFTVFKLSRLSQTKRGKSVALIPSFLFLFLGLSLIGNYLQHQFRLEKQIESFAQLEKQLPIDAGYKIVHYNIELQHRQKTIGGATEICVVKDESLESIKELKFYFNNGLIVSSVKTNGESLEYNQNLNFLTVFYNYNNKDTLKLNIEYTGKPNDDLAYFDLDKEKREGLHRYDPLLAGKSSLFVSNQYLLLTSENFWYPVVADRNAHRITRFFTSDIKIKGITGIKYLSQGEESYDGDWTVFKGDAKYSKLSLIGSEFTGKSIEVDSVKYSYLVKQDNDFFTKYFENLGDTLPNLISEIKGDFERKLGVPYPYKRLTFVEVPLHFYSYYRSWALINENTSPEMVLIPEKGLGINEFNLAHSKNRQERDNKREGTEMLPKEMEANLFMNLIGNTFAIPKERRFFFRNEADAGRSVSNWSAYSIFPLFYNYSYSIKEKELPFINMCMESYMQSRIHSSFNRFGSLSGNDKSILFLKSNTESLAHLVDEEDLKISIADIILTVGNGKFASAQQKVGIENFENFVDSLLGKFKGEAINASELTDYIGDDSGENELNKSSVIKLPAFIFGESKIYKFKDNKKESYFISLEVANVGEVDGMIKASLFGGGRRSGPPRPGGGPPGGGMNASYEDIYLVKKGQHAQIGIILSQAPRMMSVHTYLSENVPSDNRFFLADFEEAPKGLITFTGIKDLKGDVKYIRDNEFVVDNEDPGFSVVNNKGRKTLKEILLSRMDVEKAEEGFEYKTLFPWHPASRWTKVLESQSFGKYIKSYTYKKSGDGNARAQFKAHLQESGRYNVYARVPSQRTGSFRRERQEGSYEYTVFHDDGEEIVSVAVEKDNPTWELLGEFYFSDGEAVVELSDKSARRVVVADAVKWEKL